MSRTEESIDERDRLNRLAETHLVGEDSAIAIVSSHAHHTLYVSSSSLMAKSSAHLVQKLDALDLMRSKLLADVRIDDDIHNRVVSTNVRQLAVESRAVRTSC